MKSNSSNKLYVVTFNEDIWTCSCKAFEFGIRKDSRYECKHIIKLKMQLAFERTNDK